MLFYGPNLCQIGPKQPIFKIETWDMAYCMFLRILAPTSASQQVELDLIYATSCKKIYQHYMAYYIPSTGYRPLIHLRVHLIVQHSLSQTAFSVLFGYKTLVMYFSNTYSIWSYYLIINRNYAECQMGMQGPQLCAKPLHFWFFWN